MKLIRLAFTVLCVFVFLGSIAFADMYYESEVTTTGAPMGKSGPEKTTMKTYNNGENIRIDRGNQVTIIKLIEGKSYELDLEKKTVAEIDLSKMFGGNEQMAKAIKEMMDSMMKDLKVEKTAETKQINGYNCVKYNIGMMGTVSEYWVTKEVKGYDELKAASYKLAEKFKDNQLIQNTVGINSAMEKIDGFPIQTHIKMGSIETNTVITKINSDKIDVKMFEIPADYAKIEKDFTK